ncbi:MAG: hypothetical protein ICV66_01575 [Chitinophagaceae bacterium]|nr:hypothetical protein [Chitinophagaceae bacterium]
MAEKQKRKNKSNNENTDRNTSTPTRNISGNPQHNASQNRGLSDMDNEAVGTGTNLQERGSGLNTKKGVTGSDYDGQNANQ